MARIKVLGVLFRFRKPIISFVIIVFIFSFYNMFLIDRTLDNLRFTLEQTALAYDIQDTDGLDIVLTEAMIGEISDPKELDSMNLANLEYAKTAVSSGKSYRQIDYVKVTLGDVIKAKENKRGIILTVLDNLIRLIKKIIASSSNLVSSFLRRPKIKKYVKVDLELFNKAKELERTGNLEEAASLYSEFSRDYPDYERIALVKLKLAYVWHRLNEYNKALLLYKEIIKKYPDQKESDIARLLLLKLKQRDALARKMDLLITKIAELPKEETKVRQEIFYELGAINMQLLNFAEAKKFFKRAAEIDPTSNPALKSRFNFAWLTKQEASEANLEESIAEFSKIAKERPKGLLALDSRIQIADVYHLEGKYQEAIDLYLKLADDYKGQPMAALCLFQAGASYMYDLNDDDKGREILARLTREYPGSIYAKYLAPENPVGLFLTYLVPRATRVVTWRAGGLLCLTGYSGEIAKFKVMLDEKAFNQTFNDWLKKELPDTVGNLYVDIRGAEVDFLKGKGAARGRITMGKFNVKGQCEGRLELTKDGALYLIITKAFLERIPIPPILINRAISGISLMVRKYFPFAITRISMEKGEVSGEGYGSRRMVERLKRSSRELLGIEINIEKITDYKEQQDIYDSFKREFPESNFSPLPQEGAENLFYDFFTRMYLYLGFKLLETVKDTKLDYERSIRTVGLLRVKTVNFRVNYKEGDINAALNKLILNEFPWLLNEEFLYDIKGLEFHFHDNGEISFTSDIILSHGGLLASETHNLKVEGSIVLEIDKESGIPQLLFKKMSLNDKPFSVDKINILSLRGLNLLKDGHLPFKLEEVRVSEGEITLKGKGAHDFLMRIFSDPQLFVIFQIRQWDLWAAGIHRLKERPANIGDFWRGRGYGQEREQVETIIQRGAPFDTYKK